MTLTTIERIAKDCGINDPELLGRIVNDKIVFLPGDGNTPHICQIVAQLFERIETLEEIAHQHDTLKHGFHPHKQIQDDARAELVEALCDLLEDADYARQNGVRPSLRAMQKARETLVKVKGGQR